MAMAKVVIASHEAAQGISADPNNELIVAKSATEFTEQVLTQLDRTPEQLMGGRARLRVVKDYSWHANLAHIGQLLRPTNAEHSNKSTTTKANILPFPKRKSA